ncbi:hypothetical protein VFPFJ_02173 [Purpureocillium lilacinum]|uniref:Uncharacterized protein n=1 Tax=Purpureocillium lilacinum TaxID=33203 RepID=A0A179GPJ9_PURLI|nr:hypothetical protein VFPFJ_02173 [Purpureocillium lilacinum]OAQ79231.1 hypothetical protein VFPBJ_07352 [Purpureocillium lilacinum]OAQ93012.1 hypothetical protein VFPFJ_02173 [Purpureocillium lilacinum]
MSGRSPGRGTTYVMISAQVSESCFARADSIAWRVCVPKARLRRTGLGCQFFCSSAIVVPERRWNFDKRFVDAIPVSGARLSHAGA